MIKVFSGTIASGKTTFLQNIEKQIKENYIEEKKNNNENNDKENNQITNNTFIDKDISTFYCYSYNCDFNSTRFIYENEKEWKPFLDLFQKNRTFQSFIDLQLVILEHFEKHTEEFINYNGKFNEYSFHITHIKLLPLSEKLIEDKDLTEYCTECGTKNKKGNYKFCPRCGKKY